MQMQFNREDGRVVDEFKLRVIYIPANPPSPVPEGSEEGTPPRASIHENGNQNSTFEDVSVFYHCWLELLSVINGKCYQSLVIYVVCLMLFNLIQNLGIEIFGGDKREVLRGISSMKEHLS